MRVQVLAVEGAPEVPVARVEDAHAGPSVGLPAVPVTLPEGADMAGPGHARKAAIQSPDSNLVNPALGVLLLGALL